MNHQAVYNNNLINTERTTMTPVYDSNGNKIGQYDGRFVYGSIGEKLYWIDGGEVFSMPPINCEDDSGARATVKIADLTDRVAIDAKGETIFTL